MTGKFIALLSVLAFFSASRAQESTGTLGKIRQTGSITLGYRSYASPFSFIDTAGRPLGYAKDLCSGVVRELKEKLALPDLSVKYHPVTPENRVALVRDGTVDMECGSTSVSFARSETVSFSIPYFVTDIRMLSRVDSRISSIDDLGGKRVATTAGTTSAERIPRLLAVGTENPNRPILYFGSNHAESFMMVKTGYAAAFIMDDVILKSLLSNSKDPKAYAVSEMSFGTERYAVMLRKGDEAMKKFVNEALAKMMRSGEAEKMYERWFLRPIPPRDVNLNLPMSAALREIFAQPLEDSAQ
ncbi:MAG: amino acid ABC transporter substrate-binding protein [Candidatus Accumulibacter sp.]|jgi:glutamate/aspartate transport system substrate-binding protein|nr:amino acid ABC transporter substrate-binding protein [Accumulibacter sp.]